MKFLKEMFMDGTKPSWSRLGATILILTPLLWVTYLVVINHALPDLVGISGVITTGVGLYGVNKFSTPGIVKAEK